MGTLWVAGARRVAPSSAGGGITSTAPPRVVWHTTEAPSGKASMMASMIEVLKDKAAEPQLLWDPITDELVQFIPLNLSGRALKNDGATRTNRVGKVCIQIEVIAYAKSPFTDTWKPGPNFRAMMAAIRSHGIPDVFPMGNPPKYPGGSRRDRDVWLSRAGHYCHANIPGNDHGDPGAISPAKLFAAAPTKPAGGSDTMAELTEKQVYDQSYKADYQYGADFWIRGTGAALIALVREMKIQLDRIEDDTDATAKSRALVADLDANMQTLAAQADTP